MISTFSSIVLPIKHCAFRGCAWHGSNDEELITHLEESHKEQLQPAADLLPSQYEEKLRLFSVYSEAVAVSIRTGAPFSNFSIHRRCIENYLQHSQGDNIQSLICGICACQYPFVQSRSVNEISYVKPFKANPSNPRFIDSCFGRNRIDTYDSLGLDQYIADYGRKTNAVERDYSDWILKIPFTSEQGWCDKVAILCCPEDWKCIHACEKREGKSVCSDCEIPVCAACSSELEQDGYSYQDFVSLPPSRSLRNELMVFYSPFENYLHNPPLTIMEMI